MSDNNTDNATTGDGNTDNTTTDKTSTVHIPCLYIMVEKPKIRAKLEPPQNVCLLLQNLQ